MDQPDLFDLKYVRGSETSKEAAIAAEPKALTQRRKVLNILRYHQRNFREGLTDHQMQELLHMNPSTQRPRRVELVKAGLVKDSGRFDITPSGRRAVVWVAT